MASSVSNLSTSGTTRAAGVTGQRGTPRLVAPSSLFFRASQKSNLSLSAASPPSQVTHRDRLAVVNAQLKEALIDAPVASINKSDTPEPETKEGNSSNGSASSTSFPASSLSEFMAEVASLVKLVDSRDIVELQLKQLDCEVIIRKKESLPPPPSPSPLVVMNSPPSPQIVAPPQLAPAPAAAPLAPSAPAPPVVAKSPKSSHPPLKCPMAGTFYRSPAPGEPAFVKVGDKVNKGQVLCIIEAMKLMNEIEADQAGTIVEILVDDGKPVSVDMPLFVIEP